MSPALEARKRETSERGGGAGGAVAGEATGREGARVWREGRVRGGRRGCSCQRRAAAGRTAQRERGSGPRG